MTRCDMPLRCAAVSRVVRACTRTGALRTRLPTPKLGTRASHSRPLAPQDPRAATESIGWAGFSSYGKADLLKFELIIWMPVKAFYNV
jgi:hypothetical protein